MEKISSVALVGGSFIHHSKIDHSSYKKITEMFHVSLWLYYNDAVSQVICFVFLLQAVVKLWFHSNRAWEEVHSTLN